MLAQVIEAIRSLARAGELPPDLAALELVADTEIEALAIDSLGKLALLTELEDRADVALSESLLSGLVTLGDLAATLERARGHR